MKPILRGLMGIILSVVGTAAWAAPSLDARLQEALLSSTGETYLTAPDKYGTPLLLQLARRGETQTILQAARHAKTGAFLQVTDKYGNNVLHVAKDAHTVQILAGLIRQFEGAKAPSILRKLADARNQQGEMALHAQLNAGHAGTFWPIYTQTTLKEKNDRVKMQLVRLRGMDERIVTQQTQIYCQDIQTRSKANGQTLLQLAQIQARQYPTLVRVAQEIQQEMPCLVQPVN